MREVQGYPLPLGVQISENKINFSIAVPIEEKMSAVNISCRKKTTVQTI